MSARPTQLSPLVRTLRHVIFGASLSVGSLSLAYAADVAPKVYHIAPSELEAALSQFGRESGVLISYGSQITSGLKSRGLEGQYTPEQG
ncbi:Iron dicitrate transport protein fecA, partial [Pseudomonas cannabina pv. alisalensis]